MKLSDVQQKISETISSEVRRSKGYSHNRSVQLKALIAESQKYTKQAANLDKVKMFLLKIERFSKEI
jgi:hypothetical protein